MFYLVSKFRRAFSCLQAGCSPLFLLWYCAVLPKVFVAALTAAAVLACCPTALAVSPAGYTSFSEVEQTNATEEEQIAAIKAAAAKTKISYDAVQQAWTFTSPFSDKADGKAICSTTPWLFFFKDDQNLHFYTDFTYFGSSKIVPEVIYVRAGDTLYSFECDEDTAGFGYDSKLKRWWVIGDFDMLDDQVDWLREMLSEDSVIVRFYGVDGTQYDYTWTAEDRQAVTDMINLYDLLKTASPEVRIKAMNS